MKKISVRNWTTFVGLESSISDGPKINTSGTLVVKWISMECSCERKLLNSEYFDPESPVITFDEASSAVDRALELSFTRVNNREIASFSMEIEGRYVDVSLEGEVVTVLCVGSYEIRTNGKRPHEFSAKELLSLSERLKAKSSKLLSRGEESKTFSLRISAFYLLKQSVKWSSLISANELETVEDEQNLMKLQNQSYGNLSLLYLAFEDYEAVIRVSTFVIERGGESNVKVLYRRAVANTQLQNYELAIKDLEEVLTNDPTNSAAKNQIKIIYKKQSILDTKYAHAMRKFIFS